MGSSLSIKYVWLNNDDTFCLYNFIKIRASFLTSDLDSGWNWSMNLPKFSRVLSDLSLAIIRGLFASIKNVFLSFFITLQNYDNAKLDKTERCRWRRTNLKQNAIDGIRISSRKTEYKKQKKTQGISKHCRYFQS